MDDLLFSDPNGNIRPEETELPADNNDVSMIDEVPSEPVVTFGHTEPMEPVEPSLMFEHTEPMEPSEPSLTFEHTEPMEPVEPSLMFEHTEPTEPMAPVEPSLSFEGSEPFEPAEPTLTFEHTEPFTDEEPSHTEPAYEPPIGESADVRYDEPYDDEVYDDEAYDDGDYDEYYDDEYYDEEYPLDAYADDGSEAAAPFYYSGQSSHSYDPNGTEDERPVYGSYYANNSGEMAGSGAAGTDDMAGFGTAGTIGSGAAGTDKKPGFGATDTEGIGAANAGPGEASPARQAEASDRNEPQTADDRGPYRSKYDDFRFVTPGGPFAERSQSKKAGVQPRKESEEHGKKEGKKGGKGGLLGRLLTTAILAILFGIIASGVFLGVLKLTGFTAPRQEVNEIEQAVPSPLPAFDNQESRVTAGKADTAGDITSQSTELTVPEVVEMCMPSMVAITNTTVKQYYDFFGGASSRENVSVGSGIIVGETDTELLIATNNHVISNSSEITVTFIDENVVAGTVKGTDADNDLAIVAVKLEDIDNETKDAIRMISIGDSDSLSVGETVIAIGNALGYGQSVSRGVISALNREVVVDGMVHQLIQTDASINPGNSGGALLNMRGELVGINEIKYVDKNVEGVGYAIPMATAKPILDSLGARSARTIVDDDHASYIGITCIDVPSYYVQSGYPSGVYVSELTKGGPAEKAGIKEGDIITAMDGISISSTNQLITYLRYYAADEEIDFSVSRLNEDETAFEKVKIKITLGYRKNSGIDESKASEGESGPEMGAENGGFDVIPDQKR